jgi:hypothetical protein
LVYALHDVQGFNPEHPSHAKDMVRALRKQGFVIERDTTFSEAWRDGYAAGREDMGDENF